MRDLAVALIAARVICALEAGRPALDPRSALATSSTRRGRPARTPRWTGSAGARGGSPSRRHLSNNTRPLRPTSCYFEGTKCPLAQRGYSRDGKKGKLQIVFGLLCSADGCPIAVEVFEGSTSDPIATQVEKIRGRFGLTHVVLVGDRGMLTAARIREELRDLDGMSWITTLRAPTSELTGLSTGLIDRLQEPASCRRAAPRQELLAATERELEKVAVDAGASAATRQGRHRRACRQGDQPVQDGQAPSPRSPRRRARPRKRRRGGPPGIYVVRSNVGPDRLDAAETVRGAASSRILAGGKFSGTCKKEDDGQRERQLGLHRLSHLPVAHQADPSPATASTSQGQTQNVDSKTGTIPCP